MSGIATRDLSLDVVYRCVENGVGMRTRAATAPTGATSLQGKTLVLVSTSAELKEAVTAAAMKEGGKVVDATVLFVALFGAIKEGGAGGARAKVGPGDFSVKLPQTVPSEALADFDRGLSACKKKWKKPLSNEPCAQELVNAVWQRHLLRVGADLVLLLSPMTVSGAVGAEATVYAPASTSVSSSSPLAGDLKSLASMLVTRGLDTSFGTMPRKVYPTIPGDR
jgi:hypothetical protein